VLIDDLEMSDGRRVSQDSYRSAAYAGIRPRRFCGRMLFRYISREIIPSALLGTLLSTFVIFCKERTRLRAADPPAPPGRR
jgi:hypothetical protein